MKYSRHLRRAALIGFAAARLLAMTTPAVAQTRDAVAPLPFEGRATFSLCFKPYPGVRSSNYDAVSDMMPALSVAGLEAK